MAQENLKPLKILVFSMGLLLLGGTALLAALVFKKMSAGAGNIVMTGSCPGGPVDLKGRGVIADSTVEGNVMRVVLEKNDHRQEVVTIDVCSGKILGALVIDSDAQ